MGRQLGGGRHVDVTQVCFCSLFLWQIIVSYPPTKQLSSEEQDLVWKFRYYLTMQEKVGVLNSPLHPA